MYVCVCVCVAVSTDGVVDLSSVSVDNNSDLLAQLQYELVCQECFNRVQQLVKSRVGFLSWEVHCI